MFVCLFCFKYIGCYVSVMCPLVYEEKVILSFDNVYLWNTVALKIPKERRSDFQFTYSLGTNKIFSFVKKKLQCFMYLLMPAVTKPERGALKVFVHRYKMCFPELLIHISMNCCGLNMQILMERHSKRGVTNKVTLQNGI